LLGPLFGLAKAEDITGIARGIAFQLIEALGVLERAKISAEMKDLDQPSRASLRKYGVRFGAYHIYLPGLLKPAARALASLLWAEKQSTIDMAALSNAQHLAGSGRTSFPVDKSLPRDAYRVLGYRQCGERAVRVDILERLADLIRPALAWRETSPGEKPAGAFDGRGFVVTQAMTSLTGSAGEDFASVLRALGYRMEKKPPLPPKPAPVETPAPVSAETPVEAGAETATETPGAEAAAEVTAGEDAPSASLLPDVTLSPTAEATPAIEPVTVEPVAVEPAAVEAQVETQAVEAQAEPAAEASSETTATEITASETPASETAMAEAGPADASEAAPASSEAPAAPELVEVWRPGGRSEERRPRADRNRHRPQHRAPDGAQPVAATAEGGEAAPREQQHRRKRRHQDFRRPQAGAPAEVTAAPVEGAPLPSRESRPPRDDNRNDRGRPPRERFEGKGKDGDKRRDKSAGGSERKPDRDRGGRDFGRDKGGRDKGGRDSGPSHRPYASSAAPRERDRPIDPNSPFAKLAALKEQLAGNRKE
jgi:ATP-dependent RNA helicase SUPV3L1/SUV3